MPEVTDQIWAAIDELTLPTKRPIERDDGTTTWALVLSLWDQAAQTLLADQALGTGGGSASERSPIDLNLMEARGIIAETTTAEILRRRQHPRPTVPGRLRQLATYVVTNEPTELWWWSYRFASWARILGTYLQAYDHEARPVRLRNSPCSRCGARSVLVETDAGPVVAPPIEIRFREGYVQAAQCGACGKTWWRGVDLEHLASELGAQWELSA